MTRVKEGIDEKNDSACKNERVKRKRWCKKRKGIVRVKEDERES